MKARIVVLLLVITAVVAGLPFGSAAAAPERVTTGEGPLTLSVNLTDSEQIRLDPATTYGTASGNVVEQIFVGLVDLDDATGEVRPELATDWTVSSDGTVYTFTLRSDVTWSDGTPVTASDAAYGILRSLDPATNSSGAWLLRFIENAQDYSSGTITDADQVGVAAPDNTHLRITLESRASYFLAILASAFARPMPRQSIEAWGDDWTQVEHIVTNGAYRLTEWVAGDHILLEKNPTYYDAASVQIERVQAWRMDDSTAWQMYMDGELDTVFVPWGASVDPALAGELHAQPLGINYYYGFSVSQAPFDDPQVRKAFCAAIDRRGLIRDALGGPQQPEITFTPQGVFGHVDGYAENVGIPYDPAQARQWLTDAGYPNGDGLPPITLWFNTGPGHELIAEYVQQAWIDHLGVSVTLASLPWRGGYLDLVYSGEAQISRLGWNPDYCDAYNFLGDAILPGRSRFGNWTSTAYDDLLSQAAGEQDPEVRKGLYKEAERILVETDAVVIPLYSLAAQVAAKPYLRRTYPGVGGPDISTWCIYTHHLSLPMVVRHD